MCVRFIGFGRADIERAEKRMIHIHSLARFVFATTEKVAAQKRASGITFKFITIQI